MPPNLIEWKWKKKATESQSEVEVEVEEDEAKCLRKLWKLVSLVLLGIFYLLWLVWRGWVMAESSDSVSIDIDMVPLGGKVSNNNKNKNPLRMF